MRSDSCCLGRKFCIEFTVRIVESERQFSRAIYVQGGISYFGGMKMICESSSSGAFGDEDHPVANLQELLGTRIILDEDHSILVHHVVRS